MFACLVIVSDCLVGWLAAGLLARSFVCLLVVFGCVFACLFAYLLVSLFVLCYFVCSFGWLIGRFGLVWFV